jgi:hypothetical protein
MWHLTPPAGGNTPPPGTRLDDPTSARHIDPASHREPRKPPHDRTRIGHASPKPEARPGHGAAKAVGRAAAVNSCAQDDLTDAELIILNGKQQPAKIGVTLGEESVCRAWTGMLFGALILAACFDSASKLSREEEQVLDAMMFLFSGIEDNTKDDGGLAPWRREVKGRSIEFSKLGKNGIGSSDEEENRKIRQSTYVRYLERISLKEPCVFHFEEIIEFSKGDSQEDFSWHSFKNGLNTHIFNLANAHVFKLSVGAATFTKRIIELEGPRVRCTEGGYCENAWNSLRSGMDFRRFNGGDAENIRRLRAMELIKKTCPGKSY